MYTILIADDEMGITEGLKIIIKRVVSDCEIVGVAFNGVEGYNIAMELKPDIIITDIVMPQVNGLDMIKNLKEAGCNSRFIILSGYSEFEYAKKGIEQGVKFFITKPVEEEEIQECLVKVFKEIANERVKTEEIESLRKAYENYMKSMNNDSTDQFVISEDEISRLENFADIMDSDGCITIIEEIFDRLNLEKNMSFSDLKLKSFSILLYVLKKVPSAQGRLNEYIGKNILSTELISSFKTSAQLKSWLIDSIMKIIEQKSSSNIPVKTDTITEIKKFVTDNFNRDVSLSELASRFFMNPSYLSQLFKEKTGDTYLNYVMKIRINKAKELLKNSDLKIYEICDTIGYSDTNYFSKLFEKLVGCRPSCYRKKCEEARSDK